jgi:hypothetical protein
MFMSSALRLLVQDWAVSPVVCVTGSHSARGLAGGGEGEGEGEGE